MTIGFKYLGENYAIPDKGLSRVTTPKVHVARFGDGYEQRIAMGLNSLEEKFTLTFQNREKAFIDDVVDFLETKKGVTAFSLIVPDSNVTSDPAGDAGVGEREIKVVAENHTTTFLYDDYYSLTVSVRRVYEA
jgi:phage-related protein